MKMQSIVRSLTSAMAAALMGIGTTVSAANLTWNPTESAPYTAPPWNTLGVWSTSNANWWNGSANVAWNNSGGDVASFPETILLYPVTLGSDVTVASFSTSVSAFVTIGNTNPNNYAVTIEGTAGSGAVATGAASAYIYFNAPVNFSTAIRSSFTVGDTTDLRFNEGISSTGDITLNIGNFGKARIGGTSTYSGTTVMNGAFISLQVASDSALGSSSLQIRNSAALSNYIEAIDAPRTVANNIDLGAYWFTDTGKNTTIRGSHDMTFNGNVTMTGVEGDRVFLNVDTIKATFNGDFTTASAFHLTKGGNGTLILNGTNSYTGATTVDAGTLGGDATLAGALVINSGGTLAPGNSPGVMSAASLDLNGATVLEINGTNRGTEYDGLNVASGGAIDFGGTLTLNFGNVAPMAGVFDLFNFDTTATGDFTSVTSIGYGAYAGTWTLDSDVWTLDSNPGLSFSEITGDLTIVPEPGVSMLFACGLGAFAAIRRRRRG